MPHPLDNLYRGRPVFVLSTGTSLRDFDFRRLDGHLTIGVNRIVEYYHPSIMFFVDVTAKATHARALRDYRGIVIAGPGAAPHDTDATVFEINPENRAPSQEPTPFDEALRMWASEPHIVGRSFNSPCTASAPAARRCTPRFSSAARPSSSWATTSTRIAAAISTTSTRRATAATCIATSQPVSTISRANLASGRLPLTPASKLTCFPFMSIERRLASRSACAGHHRNAATIRSLRDRPLPQRA